MHRLGWVVRGWSGKMKEKHSNVRKRETERERDGGKDGRKENCRKPRNSARSFFSSFGYRTFLVLSVSNLQHRSGEYFEKNIKKNLR